MGKNARIRTLTKALKAELENLNKDLTPEQRERLFVIARKKMLADLVYQRDSKKPSA
jgi:hypothetical protein